MFQHNRYFQNCERRLFQYNACMLGWVCTMFQNNRRLHSIVRALYWNTRRSQFYKYNGCVETRTKRSNRIACICSILLMRTTKIRMYNSLCCSVCCTKMNQYSEQSCFVTDITTIELFSISEIIIKALIACIRNSNEWQSFIISYYFSSSSGQMETQTLNK